MTLDEKHEEQFWREFTSYGHGPISVETMLQFCDETSESSMEEYRRLFKQEGGPGDDGIGSVMDEYRETAVILRAIARHLRGQAFVTLILEDCA